MNYKEHVDEHLLIDYAKDQLDSDKRTEIIAHVNMCAQCQTNLKEWELLLNREQQIANDPSPYLKTRIHHSIAKHGKPKRTIAFKPIFASISGVMIVFLCVLLYINMRAQDLTYEVRQNEEIGESELFNHPNTNRLDIIPASTAQNVSGNVWINNATNEMLVEVQGLTHLAERDYQLWVIHSNDQFRSELLQLQNGTAKVYYRGEDLTKLERIKASVEPLGGSDKPTGPETFYVNFTR
ncbi:anti-sigma factor domain-containing protein [Aquibacillus salsiterrae]|uniref:Regulator of SigK n=1 Tax=Aquibacillus salsiterrae TaxID=2950439 RepID=A0A9X3WK31_9BACI|nr:anti-sigma factor [Aquibacillus salsiterrae]MDC3418531.1 anti-sigma factor [Aquibacillus salsiterrae]